MCIRDRYKNGESRSRRIIDYQKWREWENCQNLFLKMFTEKLVEPYLHKTEIGEAFMNVLHGPAEMLNICLSDPEETKAFLDILEVFSRYKLYLECAIPTALLWMQIRFNIKIYNARLCTDWGERRYHSLQLFNNCSQIKGSYDIIHPIKIGLKMRENNIWTEYFHKVIEL